MWVIGLVELVLLGVAMLVVATALFPIVLVWLGIKGTVRLAGGPWLLGVCSAVATRRRVPVAAVRLLTLLVIMLSGGFPGAIIYLLAGVFLDQWIGLVPQVASSAPPLQAASSPLAAEGRGHIGRYRITGVIGRGGMGTVYRGHDDVLHRDVAVKVLHPRFAATDGGLLEGAATVLAERCAERFAEEARSIARLASPHVVQIYEFEPQGTPPYLAMEYVAGPSLQQIIRQKRQVSAEVAVDCGRQVLAGLAAAHAAGIIHRDVKPANILRAADGTYKLTDFGLARSFERGESLTMTGTLLGTVSYLAPEVAAGEEATAASDLYSLGVTLYQLLAGTTPFGEENPLKLLRRIALEDPPPLARHREDVPMELAAWLTRLLAREPAERFASATAALAALDAIDVGLPRPGELAGITAVITDPLPQPTAARWIPRGDLDAILREAMRLEATGESLVGEKTVLEIARELDVDTAFVRRTLAASRNVSDPRRRPVRAWPGGFLFPEANSSRRNVLMFLTGLGIAVFLAVFVLSWARSSERVGLPAPPRPVRPATVVLPERPSAMPRPDAPRAEADIILLDAERPEDGR